MPGYYLSNAGNFMSPLPSPLLVYGRFDRPPPFFARATPKIFRYWCEADVTLIFRVRRREMVSEKSVRKKKLRRKGHGFDPQGVVERRRRSIIRSKKESSGCSSLFAAAIALLVIGFDPIGWV